MSNPKDTPEVKSVELITKEGQLRRLKQACEVARKAAFHLMRFDEIDYDSYIAVFKDPLEIMKTWLDPIEHDTGYDDK